MPFQKTIGALSILIGLTGFSWAAAQAGTVDGTAFINKLLNNEIRKGEKDCRKSLNGAASCKIKLRKVIFKKKDSDSADIEIVSDVKIKAEMLVEAGARAEVKAKAVYQLRGCSINVVKVSKKITKLTGMARYLKPFKKSISKIDVPTGEQPIRNNAIRDSADGFLSKRLQLASSKTAENCEG